MKRKNEVLHFYHRIRRTFLKACHSSISFFCWVLKSIGSSIPRAIKIYFLFEINILECDIPEKEYLMSETLHNLLTKRSITTKTILMFHLVRKWSIQKLYASNTFYCWDSFGRMILEHLLHQRKNIFNKTLSYDHYASYWIILISKELKGTE